MHPNLGRWLAVAIALLLIGFSVSLDVIVVHAAFAHVRATPSLPESPFVSSKAPTPTLTPTPVSSPSGFLNLENPTILAAWITVIGTFIIAIIGAIISMSLAIYQHRRAERLEKQRQRDETTRQEVQREHERERQEIQREHEREMQHLRNQQEKELLHLQSEAEAEKRENERRARAEQAAQSVMEHDKTIEEHVRSYCELFRRDARISSIEMVGMSQPHSVESVYVPVLLYQMENNGDLDRPLKEVENLRNPDVLLGAEVERLKNRFSGAFSPREAIRIYPHCIILGDPGAGKTTLLKYLALLAAENRLTQLPTLPIYIRLNDFILSALGDLLNFAALQWEADYGFPKDEARNYMEKRLKAATALLLLDALDETLIGESDAEAETSYKKVTTAIGKLATRYHAPIVITARKAGYQQHPASSLSGFTQLEVLGFRPEDISEFVNKWFKFDPNHPRQSKASDLNRKLEANPRLHTLGANPLLLSLIVLVYDAQPELPDRRAELYKRCVETLLYNWDLKRGINRHHDFDIKRKQALLIEIAWYFHTKGQRYFPEDELLQVIEAFFLANTLPIEDTRFILAEIVTQNGLLRAQAWRWYGFLHLTIQEYFVANYYIGKPDQLDSLLGYLGDPWWEEVVLLYAGQASDVNPLLQKLLGQDRKGQQREDIFQTNLLLAGRCLIDRPSIQLAEFQEEIIRSLFNTLKSTRYSLTREHCIEVLAAIGGETVNKQLLHLLMDESKDQHMRWKIVEAFGSVGERSVGSSLLQLLSENTIDPILSEIIVEALGILGDRTLARKLLNLLESTRLEVPVRRSIAKSLGMLGEKSIARALVSYLTFTRIDLSVRCSIARALGILDEKSIIPHLLELLADTRINPHVRCNIADAIGMMKQHTFAHELLNLLVKEEDERNVRYHITEAVGRSGELSLIPQLQDLAKNKLLDPHVRNSIKVAIARLGEQSVVPNLLDLLTNSNNDTDLFIRRSIVDVLGMFSDRTIIPHLMPLLSDPQVDVGVRRGIATILVKLDGHAVYPELLELLASDRLQRNVRQSIAHALGGLGEHAVVPQLLELFMRIQDTYVCQSIVEALATLGDHTAVPTLRNILANEQGDPLVRLSIVNALGKFANDSDTVEVLYALLSTEDIADAAYRSLWSVSRRAGVRIFLINE